MATNSTNRERRDWTLIIFLLPIGILLMLVAGQIAIRLVPSWRVDAGMQSNLDPESAAKNQPGLIQPISFDIMTPIGWLDSFLTPGANSEDGISFAPFIILEPSLTPSPIASATSSATAVTPTATPSATTTTATSSATPTKKPTNDDDDPTPTPTTPTPTCTDVAANNNGGSLPCIYPTSSPLVGASTTPDPDTNIGPPDGDEFDNNVGHIQDGYYIILTLSATPIVVNGPFDTGYDFVYYERPVSGGGVDMDSVILSISMDDITYYVVFDWGDGVADNNSNVGDVAGLENDNQHIDGAELYGSSPNQTGIAVDVDNAPSNPPNGTYQYLAIQAPLAPPADGDDGADVDSVEVLP